MASNQRTRKPLNAIAKFDAANLQAAEIIAADPVKYPGGAQEWARLVLARAESQGGAR
jgi:hypothetical protein